MNISRLNIFLGILFLAAISLSATMQTDLSVPNYEFLPEMKRTAASKAFAPSPVLPGGRTMQTPVERTILRGELPLAYTASKEDAVRAGDELLNPFTAVSPDSTASPQTQASAPEYPQGGLGKAGEHSASADAGSTESTSNENPGGADAPQGVSVAPAVSAEPDHKKALQLSVERGTGLYAIYCACCHGASGAGDGPVAKRGFPPPPPLATGKSAQMKDGQLFHILTYGQGSMPSMAGQLSRAQRWDLVNFVRSLQKNAPAATSETVSAAASDALALPAPSPDPPLTGVQPTVPGTDAGAKQ